MPFYYLHEVGTEMPKNERGFKYLVYHEKEFNEHTTLKIKPDEANYCLHETGVKSWDPDDSEVLALGPMGVINSRFKKTSDWLGFTVWENQDYIRTPDK